MFMGSSPSHDDSDMCSDEEEDYYDDDENEMSFEEEEYYADAEVRARHSTVECEVIPTSIANLQDIASLTTAIALYKHVDVPGNISAAISRLGNTSNFLEVSIYNSVVESMNKLSSRYPKKIIDYIRTYVDKMRKQIKDWVPYNYRNVFFLNRTDHYGFNHIQHLVWYSNGTIDTKGTARSLLNSIRLTELEKYYLLCTYCMKDDFERLSSSFRTHYVVDKFKFEDYPLICYWNYFFKNELHKVPMGRSGSVDTYMIQRSKVDNWPAKEYFFDRLNSEEQVRIAIWLIDNYGLKYMKLILMKLDEPRRLHVYMDRAVKIMTIYITSKSSFEEIRSTWLEIRNLINKDEFVKVFNLLLNVEYDSAILEAVWTSACDEYKDHFLNVSDQFGSIEKILSFWTLNLEKDFFFDVMRDADESLKAKITEEWFFKNACEKFIRAGQLTQVDRLLKACFVDTQEITEFKKYLAQQDYFADQYLSLVLANQLDKLEQMLNSFFPDPKNWLQFKQNVIKKSCFRGRIVISISSYEFPSIEQLLNLFPAESEEVLSFKKNFVEESVFMNLSENLIIDGKISMLKRVWEVFIPQLQDMVKFKQQLSGSGAIEKYCEKLMFNDQDGMLQDLMNWLFANAEESAKFKRDLFVNSTIIKSRCSNHYCNRNLKSINTLLNRFMSPYPGLIAEYKKNIIISSMHTSVQFFEQSPEIFSKMVAEGFLPTKTVAEIKKTIIFSPSAVEKMKSMIQDGYLHRVKDRFNQFLTSEEDKKTLKAVVIGSSEDVMKMMPTFFHKHSQSIWQFFMIWWLGNENMIREFKRTLCVDEVFNTMLKYCVFEKYDERFLRNCRFKSNISFRRLDEFLLWVFETSQKVKEYKMKRVNSYMNIDTIRTLSKKKDVSYVKTVMQWFFAGDQQEVTKFKNGNKGRKITRII